ncbi:MAG TPA: M48 family metalloprotease, partial [Alphaproteobacteria bacterium]|nr:M48 family metalloprotease [Alphaproteobacteria bacterium]
VFAAALVAVLLALGSCAENPATGERYFSLMSSAEEQQVGAEEHPKLVQSFGGEYKDPELQHYIDSIGALLAKTTETPNQKFTFTIIDSPIINAFALPGGYVHVTRGLIALANNEAELASVLGHEMGHVTAHHSAQLYTRSVLSNILAAGIGLATGSNAVGSVLSQGADVYLKSYSRENEYQADSLGVRYIKRAGYDPEAMAEFLNSLEASSRLEAELDGLPPDSVDKFNIMATHPRTPDRVQRAIEEAGGAHGGELDRDVYLKKINGIIFGDSPDQGYVRGDRFAHPKLGFEFQVPTGFKLANQPEAVIARNPNGALIAFDEMPKANGLSPRAALAQIGIPLSNVEDIDINGLSAATGQGRGSVNGTTVDVRVVVIRFSPEHMFRFLFITPPQLTAGLADGFKRTTYSFRRLSPSEAAALKPYRVQVVRVKSGDTVASLANRVAFPDRKEERFRVLNGLQPNDTLKPGTLVKIVVDHDVPKDIQ